MDELIADVADGFLVEGGVTARADPSTLRCVVRATRAREIKNGRRTGRLYGTVDLVTDVPTLLSKVRGISKTSEAFATTRAVGTGGRFPISIDAPHLLTRARVFGLRRPS